MTNEEILKGYNKPAHRYNQYGGIEVAIYCNKNTPGYNFYIGLIKSQEEDETLYGPWTKAELETIRDCLTIDLDLQRLVGI